jgi:hypothetical protein
MKILDHIFDEKALKKSSKKKPAYGRDYFPEPDPGFLTDVVDRPNADIPDTAIFNVQLNKDVIRHPIFFYRCYRDQEG